MNATNTTLSHTTQINYKQNTNSAEYYTNNNNNIDSSGASSNFDLSEKTNEIVKLLNSKASSQIKQEIDKVIQFASTQQGTSIILETLGKVIENIFSLTKDNLFSYKHQVDRFLDFFNFFNGELNLKLLMNMDQLRKNNLTNPENYKAYNNKVYKRAGFHGRAPDQKKIKEIILNKLNKTVASNQLIYNSSTNAFLNRYVDLVAEFGQKFKEISDEFANSV